MSVGIRRDSVGMERRGGGGIRRVGVGWIAGAGA